MFSFYICAIETYTQANLTQFKFLPDLALIESLFLAASYMYIVDLL